LSGKTGKNRWQLNSKTEKVTSLSPGRDSLTIGVPKPKNLQNKSKISDFIPKASDLYIRLNQA